MFNKLLISWMLHNIFYASVSSFQLLIYTSWLSAKLNPIMDMTLMRLQYFFNVLEFALEGGASLDP